MESRILWLVYFSVAATLLSLAFVGVFLAIGPKNTFGLKPIDAAALDTSDVNVTLSEESEYLMLLAKRHAESMAHRGKQDHLGFNERAMSMAQAGLMGAAEICAESWEHQSELSEQELWAEAFSCWRKSPGHWAVASKVHKHYGYGAARSVGNIWYFCIITSE